jgi:hypothetical protein
MELHYDGKAWDWVSGGFQMYLGDVAVAGREVFAVGDGTTVVHFDGHNWSQMPTSAQYRLNAVDAWDGGAIAVGPDAIVRYDGTTWRAEASPVSWELGSVIAFSPNHVIAVGDDPRSMVVFDGRSWKIQPIDSYRNLNRGNANTCIWGTSLNNFYILQYAGMIHHYDGRTWTELPQVVTRDLTSLVETPNGDVLVSAWRHLLRYRPR